MIDLTIRDIFDLPTAIPRCIVKIQDFDGKRAQLENIHVINNTEVDKMEGR